MKTAPREIQQRQLALFSKYDPARGAGVIERPEAANREQERAVGR